MSDKIKLHELLEAQSELLGQIQLEYSKLSSDYTAEKVEALKEQNELLNSKCDQLNKECLELNKSYVELEHTFDEQIKNEKRTMAGNSKDKMRLYFGETKDRADSRLEALEKQVKKRLEHCYKLLEGDVHGVKETYIPKLEMLQSRIHSELETARQAYEERERELAVDYNTTLRSMAATDVTKQAQDEIKKPQKEVKKVERILGLNILSAVGAGFIVLAAIVLAFFLYDYIPAWANAVILFSSAALVLALGLFMNRKRDSRTVFSLTILSIGVGFMYAALAVSYFFLGVLNIWAALGVCAAITAIVYIISIFYKSQLIVIFAQIGGYLPIMTLIERFVMGYFDMSTLYASMGYFIILGVLGFIFSTKYKWQVLNFIGFGFNVLATIFVAVSVAVHHTLGDFGLAEGITLLYIFVSFALHTLLPVVTNIRTRSRFKASDFVLIIVATVTNLVLMFVMVEMYSMGLNSTVINMLGFVSLFFALFYIGLYYFVLKLYKQGFAIRTIFWLTAIVYAMLFVPLQLFEGTNRAWISVGWLVMAVAMIIFSILKSKRFCFVVGCAMAQAAVGTFIILNTIIGAFLEINYVAGTAIYIYIYLIFTLASIAILAVAIYKRKMVLGYIGRGGHAFKQSRVNPSQMYSVAVYLNLLGFLLYATWHIFASFFPHGNSLNNQLFLMLLVMAALMFTFSDAVPKLFRARAVRAASMVLSLISLLFLMVVLCLRLPVFWGDYVNLGWQIGMGFAICFIAIASIFVFTNLYLTFNKSLAKGKIGKGLVIATACYFLFFYTLIVMNQFGVHITSIAVTIPYIVVAFVCIGLGLYMRSAMTRRFAIALVLIAISKLFIVDTWALNLDLIYQVINYAVFGVLLIGMSLLYQMFYRKLKKKDKQKLALSQSKNIENIKEIQELALLNAEIFSLKSLENFWQVKQQIEQEVEQQIEQDKIDKNSPQNLVGESENIKQEIKEEMLKAINYVYQGVMYSGKVQDSGEKKKGKRKNN